MLFTGVIRRYEVFLRGPIQSQNLSVLPDERRVFFSSDWFESGVSLEAQPTNKSTFLPSQNSTVVTGLQAFSTYQMRVVSINKAGSATSAWTTASTMEGGL